MIHFLEKVNSFVWGAPALTLILGVGIWLSIKTRLIQIRFFPKALSFFLKPFFNKNEHRGSSSYRALCTALAATVGTGNLAGVAGAITIGGPGAVFWMWICAILGMVIKFTEATLSIRYRECNDHGEYLGGPMYMAIKGMPTKWHWLAGLYAFFGVIASFGVGNATQINTVIASLKTALNSYGYTESRWLNFIVGLLLALLVTIMFRGGSKRIGKIAEGLIPLLSMTYLLISLYVLIVCRNSILNAFKLILQGAFCPQAVTGGMIGSMFQGMRVGASRGTFTNEAGMGTASIAHASAKVNHPCEQGLMGIMEVFIDTILICTMTALVILCSGVRIPYGEDTGIALTTNAFVHVCGPWVSFIITISLCLFALATVLGWGLYGGRCAQYLFGEKAWDWFVFCQAVMVVVGAVLSTDTLWLASEIVNGLMVIPNLIILTHLTPELSKLVKKYEYHITKRV